MCRLFLFERSALSRSAMDSPGHRFAQPPSLLQAAKEGISNYNPLSAEGEERVDKRLSDVGVSQTDAKVNKMNIVKCATLMTL